MLNPWLNWETAGALLACVALVAVPLWIRHRVQKKAEAAQFQRQVEATKCESCGTQGVPLAYLDYTAYEGWFVKAYKSFTFSSVVCGACAERLVAERRQRALQTWWRCFQGPILILLTFLNTREALERHAEFIRNQKTGTASTQPQRKR